MSNIRRRAACLFATILMVCSANALAGVAATGCEDLSGFAEVPQVDFESQIQPILDNCTGCHGDGGFAGLDMRPGESYDNLVGVTSTTNPTRQRIEPFVPENSAVLLAVNCSSPGGPGFQMGNVSLEDRALIRDWIVQGALPEPQGEPAPEPISVPVDQPWALILLIGTLLLLGSRGLRCARSV